MRLRLLHRLFLAFAALSVAALAAFVVLQQDGFRRGFLDYLDGLSVEMLSAGSVQLAERYEAEGSWDFLRGRNHLLMDTLGIFANSTAAADASRRRGDDRPPPPGPAPPRHAGSLPPPRPDSRDSEGRPRPYGPGRPPQAGRMPGRDPLDIGGRLLLVDRDGVAVAGDPDVPRDARSIDIMLHGERIGSLRLRPLPRWRDQLDEAFAHSQWRRALLGGAAILVCALLLAWTLARWLQRPIRALAVGAQALAAGHFATRVRPQSDDELGELAADFNRLAETLERNQTARRQWGADIAHELRTPLAILHGEMQALQDGVRPFDAKSLASLQAETMRLTALVDDLYQLALSDAGALEYRMIDLDLCALIEDAVQSQVSSMQDAGLRLRFVARPLDAVIVRGDSQRLLQLMANLLANCRRYTDAPGTVQCQLQVLDARCVVFIDDTAPGVPKASLPLLFERMYRADGSRNRASGGAGLGLSIARKIVEAHGGCIVARPSPLGGVRIVVELPIAGAPR